jgi:hypothetical protein
MEIMRLTFMTAGTHLRAAACVVVALGIAAGATAGDAPSPVGTPPAVPWSVLHFSAHKLFLKATATVRAEVVPTEATAAAIRRPPRGQAVPVPSPWLVRVTTESDLPFGRSEVSAVLLDPATGAAVQAEKEVRGSHPYAKVFRYLSRGFFEWRMAPSGDREARLAPEAWSHRKEELVTAAGVYSGPVAITDPYALLYLVSTARLDAKGASLDAYIVSDERLVRLVFHDDGLTYAHASFDESWPGGAARRSGDILVRTVRVTGEPVGADTGLGEVDLGFLGMRGELTILLEVGTGVPVELSGHARTIGHLRVALESAVLTRPPSSAGAPAPAPPPSPAVTPAPSPTATPAPAR